MSGRLKDRVEAEANRLLRERIERLRESFESALSGFSEPLRFPLTPGEWGAASGTEQLQIIRDAIDSIARHQTQREILSAVLDSASAVYPRCALFIVRGPTLSGWAGLGFLGDGGFSSESVSKVSLSVSGHHVLARAVAGRAAVRASSQSIGEEVKGALGGVQPADACAAPVVVRGRPVAILYGDTGGNPEGGDPLVFEILARAAALAMERLAAPHRRARAGADAPASAGTPSTALAPAAIGVTPPEEAELQAILADLSGRPPVASGDGERSDDERRRLADARRFAHLLVSELLLYNEAAVIQGRKHRDLYTRLRKEIDRSRQAFQARFPAMVKGTDDFFAQELLRTLAQGDRGLLGA